MYLTRHNLVKTVMDANILNKGMFFILLTIVSFFFFKNLVYYVFGIYDIENHKNRLKQLDFSGERRIGDKKKEEELNKTRDLINTITSPIIRHIMPNISYNKDLYELEKNLKFAGIDKYVTPAQYTALILLGRAIGFTAFVLLLPYNFILALLWFSGPAILPSLLFKNTVVNKKSVILMGFPDFINISKSYLASGMSFEKAVEESIYYVNKEWQELLKEFLSNSETYSRKECLTMLAENSNSFEIREFISIIKLNAEQGIDIKDSFDSQYDKIKDLQKLAIQKKIESRKVWAVLIQAPVLLTILGAFGLPVLDSMLGSGGFL